MDWIREPGETDKRSDAHISGNYFKQMILS